MSYCGRQRELSPVSYGKLIMRWLVWILRFAVFLLLCAFAIRNTDPVDVRFFLDTAWQAPLAIMLFAFFAAGVASGMLFLLASLLGRRREIARLKRELSQVRARLVAHRERPM
ncbi:LapA family protein [Accumulibacter sp.]|nr:LapA family protein [Accumulibacter sp.]